MNHTDRDRLVISFIDQVINVRLMYKYFLEAIRNQPQDKIVEENRKHLSRDEFMGCLEFDEKYATKMGILRYPTSTADYGNNDLSQLTKKKEVDNRQSQYELDKDIVNRLLSLISKMNPELYSNVLGNSISRLWAKSGGPTYGDDKEFVLLKRHCCWDAKDLRGLLKQDNVTPYADLVTRSIIIKPIMLAIHSIGLRATFIVEPNSQVSEMSVSVISISFTTCASLSDSAEIASVFISSRCLRRLTSRSLSYSFSRIAWLSSLALCSISDTFDCSFFSLSLILRRSTARDSRLVVRFP